MPHQFPFWNTFFRHLGYRVVLSEETNHRLIRSGTEISVAEPCLPIQAYHGHVKELVDKQVDWIFIPNTINAETPFKEVNSYYCPWGQTIPFVIKNSEVFASISEKNSQSFASFPGRKKCHCTCSNENIPFIGRE
ncbi:hypothetical protein B1H10_05780 [candidate division KSB1 bacterium 4484_188]|nr:MAG: hypothetical protein B1H10_05780 [candidate division KSB1 bacterium 4484_188]